MELLTPLSIKSRVALATNIRPSQGQQQMSKLRFPARTAAGEMGAQVHWENNVFNRERGECGDEC